tara:strand:- start:47 stop:292 length:246 start_codon:yes stop_codon:yes gene_type:complete
MIFRERTRSWKRTVIELLTVATQANKNKETFEELTSTLNDFYSMVVHKPGAYDLSRIIRSKPRGEITKEDLLKKLEGIPDV